MHTTELLASDHTNLAILIRHYRARTYRTAKDFWEEHEESLKTSYPHYAAVEAGKKFPDIDLTIAIAKILKIELRLACHLWAREQMPTAETRAFFEPIPGVENKGVPSSLKYNLDEFYVFTEKQLPKLKENPHLWEVLVFIMAYTTSTPPTENEITKALGLNATEVNDAVEWLRNEGLVYSEIGRLKSRRKFYHLPNTPEFKAIRDQNFRNASSNIIKSITPESLAEKTAYRTTYMRRLTPKQAEEICLKIDELIAHLGNLDELGTEFYVLTVGFAPRATLKKKDKSA